jgi:hypothetical protein
MPHNAYEHYLPNVGEIIYTFRMAMKQAPIGKNMGGYCAGWSDAGNYDERI